MIHLSHTVLNIYLSQFRSGDHFVLTHTWFLSEYLWVFFSLSALQNCLARLDKAVSSRVHVGQIFYRNTWFSHWP